MEFDNNWYEDLEMDFQTILELFGFWDIETFFSGFHSQGDGASFRARFERTHRTTDKIKNYAPLDEELQEIAKYAVDYIPLRGDYSITTSGRYCHEMTMQCQMVDDTKDHSEDVLKVARWLAVWYYKKLEELYEYLNGDEQVLRTLVENEYEFNSKGEIQ